MITFSKEKNSDIIVCNIFPLKYSKGKENSKRNSEKNWEVFWESSIDLGYGCHHTMYCFILFFFSVSLDAHNLKAKDNVKDNMENILYEELVELTVNEGC